ncbi:glucose-6-phosphate isomerase 1, chloroplastic [Brassica rapa]|uniref:Glucose-6-phosphate isomerase n=1 Tax=Brassica campestris TaxID=3711 RepID=M4DBF9_BRACM|nr:glucose-6-phosphate isomerase 1, chloroplastic [Brassica rapa]
MASLSTLYSSSPSLKQSTVKAFTSPPTTRGDSFSFPHTSKPTTHLPLTLSASRSHTSHSDAASAAAKKELIKDPDALWKRYLDWLYQQKDIGLYLDVSRVGFTDEFVVDMEERFKSAFKAMEELEKGSIANPDEGRMVGHYWLRNSSLAPRPALKTLIENTLDSICSFADDIVSGKIKPPSSPAGRFTQILSVGIGGSALGPQFVAEALAPDNPPLKIRFIDNTDPAGIDHQIAQLGPELASTLVIVISKSGGTPETRNGLLEVQKAFRDAGLNFAKQGVAITQENSLLDNTARIEGWLARFPMYDWVGGRTSVMSAVGLLPAALQGIDIREMLAGAAIMDEATRTNSLKNNPAALLAMCWYWASDGVGSKDMVILPYKDSLLLFSRYLQQLVMESLGKEFDLDGNTVNQGLTVYGNKGSTDQHAYIQQLREGVHNFFATFIEVLRDRPPGHDWDLEPGVTCGDYLFGMLQGTRSALYANGRESISVTIEEVTPRSVGALIALYERAVGLYASLVNINAYHQPGVEAGKKAAAEVLALQKRVLSVLNEASCKDPVEPLTLDEIADRCHAPEEIEMIYKIIAHMSANDRVLIAEGSCGSPRSVKVFLGECNVDDMYA